MALSHSAKAQKGSIMKHRKLNFLAAIAAATALVLTGCSSGDGGGGGGNQPPVESGDPVYGGTLRLHVNQDAPHLNRNILSQPALSLTQPLWGEQLINRNADGELEPALATEWNVSDDNLTYTFTLRDGVTWHDGEAFTADDVVWTLENSMPLNPRTNAAWELVSSLEATDDMTVTMTMTQPYGPLLALLSGSLITMLPEHLYAGTDLAENPVNSAPIGTGPYKFVAWDRGQQITWEKNEDYWQEGKPYYDDIVVRIISSEVTAANALKNEEIHALTGSEMSPQVRADLLTQSNLVERESMTMPTQYVMGFNTYNGVMEDPAVRRAIVQAIDREQIYTNVFGGIGGVVPDSVIPSAFAQLTDTENTYEGSYAYDPEAAGEALDAAGYPMQGNSRFSIDILVPMGDVYLNPANVIKAQLEAIGVMVNVEQLDEQSHADRVYIKHEYDAYISSYLSDVDPALGVERLYSCDTLDRIYGNGTGYCNEDVQAAFEAARATADPVERQAQYSIATQQILEDMPRLALVNYSGSGFFSTSLANIEEEFFIGDGSNSNWADSWFVN